MPVASLSTMAHRMRRTILAGAATALALALTTACTPDPAPSPTPTGFASEEDAFAAAEATVHEYFDASNRVVLSDPETFEDVFALTAADQNAFDRKRYSEYNAESYVLVGSSDVVAVQPSSWDPTQQMAVVDVCLDVSTLDLQRADGTSLVSADRPDEQNLQITLQASSEHFLITSIEGSDQSSCGT